MTKFRDTDSAANFIATANSRETSTEVMRAIAYFARNDQEAVALWAGDGFGTIANLSDIWENATNNGSRDDTQLLWCGRTLAAIMADRAGKVVDVRQPMHRAPCSRDITRHDACDAYDVIFDRNLSFLSAYRGNPDAIAELLAEMLTRIETLEAL